jgi:hypothetical protein
VLAAAIERRRTNHPPSAEQPELAAEVMPGGNRRGVLFQSPRPRRSGAVATVSP